MARVAARALRWMTSNAAKRVVVDALQLPARCIRDHVDATWTIRQHILQTPANARRALANRHQLLACVNVVHVLRHARMAIQPQLVKLAHVIRLVARVHPLVHAVVPGVIAINRGCRGRLNRCRLVEGRPRHRPASAGNSVVSGRPWKDSGDPRQLSESFQRARNRRYQGVRLNLNHPDRHDTGLTRMRVEGQAAPIWHTKSRRKKGPASLQALDSSDFTGTPKGTRTPVFAVRGRRPRPLDDGSNQGRRFVVKSGACVKPCQHPAKRGRRGEETPAR